MEFRAQLEKAASKLNSIGKDETIRVVSHLDADGICSAAIAIKTLKNEGYKYALSIVKQLAEENLLEFANEDYDYYIFTDLGSGQYDLIQKYIGKKQIIILDHHSFDKNLLDKIPENIIMVNPHIFGINGSKEISGSGVVYLFSETVNEKNKELAHLAIVGAIGDMQEKEGFIGLNKKILETAIEQEKIEIKRGLKWFGIETKPLYRLIAYSTEPIVPGVAGSESKAIQFLKSLNIEPKQGNKWTKYNDLTEKQKERFVSAVIMKRSNEENPQKVIGDRYILLEEKESSPTRDAREFSTLLNSSGRMDRASYGIGACLNDPKSKKKAIQTLMRYKKEIVYALKWYEDNPKRVIKGENYIIINAGKKVLPTIIGTLASIISNNLDLEEKTIILSMAKNDINTTKVSIRIAGKSDLDLMKIIKKITEKVGGQSGGHKSAAGAIIPSKVEKQFIEEAKKVFNQIEDY